MPSVGPVIIPVQSTFDPKGIEQAKVGIRDVQQAQQKASQLPGEPVQPLRRSDRTAGDRLFRETRTEAEKYQQQVTRLTDLHGKGAISADTYQRSLKQAQEKYMPGGVAGRFGKVADLAKQSGIPGMEGLANVAGKLATPMMGLATASVGAFVGLQKAAVQAREVRLESLKLGTSVGFYKDLSWYAREAGISMEEAAGGVRQISGMASGARGGDLASQAYMASLGIRGDQLWSMDNGQLANQAAKSGNAAQQIQGFGSQAAAQAAAKSQPNNNEARLRNDALESANLKINELPAKAAHGIEWVLGQVALGAQITARSVATGRTIGDEKQAMLEEADVKQQAEKSANLRAAKMEAGTKHGTGLLNVRERMAAQAESEKGFDYSQVSALTGVSEQKLRYRAETARDRQTRQFDAQYQNPRERARSEKIQAVREYQGGELTNEQAYRKVVGIDEQRSAALSGVRSGGENLSDQMRIAKMKWNDPSIAKGEREERQQASKEYVGAQARTEKAQDAVDTLKSAGINPAAAMKELKASQAAEAKGAEKYKAADKAYKEAEANSPERKDQARQMGDSLTDFAQGMTSSGAQAGAYGVNTVQGASAMMGAEYQMDQSKQTMRMVELLTTIAVNTGKMTPDQAKAVRANLGYRSNDPISDLFGNNQ